MLSHTVTLGYGRAWPASSHPSPSCDGCTRPLSKKRSPWAAAGTISAPWFPHPWAMRCSRAAPVWQRHPWGAARQVTQPGFLNTALHTSNKGNSSWLCQSRKGGLYPVPGLETAPAELEAMGSRTGVQGEKLLTGWENCCCQEGQMWQGQCCCPVSGREH